MALKMGEMKDHARVREWMRERVSEQHIVVSLPKKIVGLQFEIVALSSPIHTQWQMNHFPNQN